ncbi:MAG TPA: Cas10/Cmr2 second palm domain-containing protein, partial [Elainellaceae cyanobacterium]
SSKLVEHAQKSLSEDCVISPGLINVERISQQEGMPNRILVKGYLDRTHTKQKLLEEWQNITRICRLWIEDNLRISDTDYYWAQKEKDVGNQKKDWESWGVYTWELFWGTGSTPIEAMEDLETRKLKRDWTGINWMGESSTLSGTDAIAWHQLGRSYEKGKFQPGQPLGDGQQQELTRFYRRLAWVLDDPTRRNHKSGTAMYTDEQLEEYFRDEDNTGKFIAPNEKLSIPELVKRLVTYDYLARDVEEDIALDVPKLKGTRDDPEFKDIVREAGYWTGWFLGDGDKVGDKLKTIANRYSDDHCEERDQALKCFTQEMRGWGQRLKEKNDLFPDGKGRIIYAGGDDFLGVLYSEEPQNKHEKPEKVKPIEAWNWLLKLPEQWKELQRTLAGELQLDGENQFTYSVGFVWAGHQVPQRDILQHCREAEQRAKSLGRDRLTIRVLFNSGQCIQWTCPWSYLDILTKYRDRDGINTEEEVNKGSEKTANWNHIYSDWETLKARHAIRLQDMEGIIVNKQMAVSIFDLYFGGLATRFEAERKWEMLTGDSAPIAIVSWMNDLIQVGWQLCRNSNL